MSSTEKRSRKSMSSKAASLRTTAIATSAPPNSPNPKSEYGSQYRTGLPPVPADCPGKDQARPEEVHLSGRADREKGERFCQHSDPADRNAELPLRPPEYGRRGTGRGRTRHSAGARRC